MTEKGFCEIVERSRRAMRTPDGSTSCLLCGRGPLVACRRENVTALER